MNISGKPYRHGPANNETASGAIARHSDYDYANEAYGDAQARLSPRSMDYCIESLILNERFPCDSYEGFYIYKLDDIDESGRNRPLICIRNLATGASFHAYRWQPIESWMRSQLEKAA